jgi:cytochrome c peroxidase
MHAASLIRSVPAALALAVATLGCGVSADNVFCDGTGCDLSDVQWSRLRSLAGALPAPTDPSNKFLDVPKVQALGQAFYYDARFSGPATLVDALGRPTGPTRAPAKGGTTNVSCATCHDLSRMGIDLSSTPNNVSSGAGWTDVNALATVNSAYQRLFFTNGRADSSWALNAAVAESGTTMNGDRLHTFWVIADNYRKDFESLFGPLPVMAPSCDFPDPRFPLHGKPGSMTGCQAGLASEPFGDAFDCMAEADQVAVTTVLVNWAKALAAFESRLVTGEAPFDVFVNEGPGSTAISPLARRGAALFVGKAGCFDCHNTRLLSDREYHNIGVPQAGPFVPMLSDCGKGNPKCDCVSTPTNKCLPQGAYDGLTRLQATKAKSVHLNFLRSSPWSDGGSLEPEEDPTYVVPAARKGAWRTPSLRNVELTAPYMHDGLYKTLEEVVWHYSNGADPGAVGVPEPDLRPLRLADDEQAALVAFLRTLTSPQLGPEFGAPPLPPSVCP